MLKLMVEVVYLVCGLWAAIEEWSTLDDVWFRHVFGEFSGDNFLDIISDGLSWVGIELLVHGGAS